MERFFSRLFDLSRLVTAPVLVIVNFGSIVVPDIEMIPADD